MPGPGIEISLLDTNDSMQVNETAAVASRAFQFDPFFIFLSPNHLLRARGLALFWRAEVAAFKDRGEIYVAKRGDRILGVAAWVKPGCWPLPVGAQLRQGLGALWALIPQPSSLVKGSKYLLAIEKVHPKERHWYLAMLVADPSAQRTGIGGALQEVILQRADEEGIFTYLETQNEDNLPYYRRFGYEVVEQLHPVQGGPPLWTMRREPKG